METDTRNSTPKAPVEKGPAERQELAPKERRVPLRVVVFNGPTAIPTLNAMVTTVEVGAWRLIGGKQVRCPRPFLDPVNRTIWIEGREFPMERVHYWERDKTGFMPEAEPLEDHTIGKKCEPRTEKAPA